MPASTALPIWKIHADILRALQAGNRLVLVAPTDSGKTTQVPPMLLDAGIAGDKMIVVLQPRRVAALTVDGKAILGIDAIARWPIPDDGVDHQVQVTLGATRNPLSPSSNARRPTRPRSWLARPAKWLERHAPVRSRGILPPAIFPLPPKDFHTYAAAPGSNSPICRVRIPQSAYATTGNEESDRGLQRGWGCGARQTMEIGGSLLPSKNGGD